MVKIALILGYGNDLSPKLENSNPIKMETPYGEISSDITTGTYQGTEIFILKRHGEKGDIPSFRVNFKANVYALYQLGCTHIVSTSVCGSLREEITVGEYIVFDQFIDLTTHSEQSFCDKLPIEGLNHSAFHKPFTDEIRNSLIQASIVSGFTTHTKGIVMAVDGPRQSTRAESNLYRKLGADVINTTTTQEAILAHELNIMYGAISLCTYFDTWRTDIPPATRGEKLNVIEVSSENVATIIQSTLKNLIEG